MATIEQLEKQVAVLIDTNKLLNQVILEKNEMIGCLEILLKAEEIAEYGEEINEKNTTN
tara:strand:- start:342 stop:518 length:177 start_codon:yes stop_codon:yes gene_type:complete